MEVMYVHYTHWASIQVTNPIVQGFFVKIRPNLELREGRDMFSLSCNIRSLVSPRKTNKLNSLGGGGGGVDIGNIPISEKRPHLYVSDRFK